MAQETNRSQVPMLCSTGCGFYGNPRTNGMCSVCYKEHLQRQNSNGRISPPATSVSSITESLPVQCTEGSAQETQSTLDSTLTPSMQPSPVSSPSLLTESVASSQPDSTAVDKTVPETEDLQGGSTVNAVQLMASTSVELIKATSVGRTGKELMDPSGFCDSTRGSEVEYDYDTSVENNVGYPDLLDECSRERGNIHKKDLKLNSVASVSENAEPTPEEPDKSLDKPKQKKNRCFMCRKKVGLTGFECRCGNVYCGMHRYSDVHSCSYNYKADAAEKIRKENPVVVGEKIQKI